MPPKTHLPDLIGNTPLLHLRQASAMTGCDIYGKAEFLNPGGSVKDRTALGIIRDAEARGELEPGGVIVEGTAGNTGIGLTLLANALGYRSVVVIPDTQSREKQDLLDLYGADLRVVPATRYEDPKHYIHQALALSKKLKQSEAHGAICARQFDNTANSDIHRVTTGEEIWQQTDGKIDGFVCSSGTGGTISGVSQALKSHHRDVRIALADPMGSGLYHYVMHGELKAEGNSVSEGIGVNFLTENMKLAQIDTAYQIPDAEALPLIYQLLKQEGICLGGSSAINIAGAVRMAQELGPGHTIVTILCDYGDRYQSKIYNPTFLRRRGLPAPDWII